MSEVFVKELGTDLDVPSKFKELVAVSTGANSPYILAKESMLEYFSSIGSNLSDREKSQMLSELVGSMASKITSDMMQVAVKIEVENRDSPYQLAKIVADTKNIDVARAKAESESKYVDAQIKKIEASIESEHIDDLAKEAGIFSKTGFRITPSVNGPILNYSVDRDDKATDLASIKNSEVDRFTKLASSYRKDGEFELYDDSTFTVTPSTATTEVVVNTSTTDAQGVTVETTRTETVNPYEGLVAAQTKVGLRNVKGFNDNMLQHAVNSSASAVSMMLSTDAVPLDQGAGKNILDAYSSALADLSNKN